MPPHIKLVAVFMTNDDVVVSSGGDRIQTSRATSIIALFGSQARETLVEQLDKPAKFAAAHVALSKMEFPKWNRQFQLSQGDRIQAYHYMPFTVGSHRRLQFDFHRQPPLKRWWREYLSAKDGRERLPVCSGVLLFGDGKLILIDNENDAASKSRGSAKMSLDQ